MRYRGSLALSQSYGKSYCVLQFPSILRPTLLASRSYCTPQQNPKNLLTRARSVQQHTGDTLKSLAEAGKQWGHNSAKTVSATVNFWWGKYEEFVGLNEVREAQAKVTEAEKAFMVARGMVREAHGSLEALQGRLKEVRDRLDRVSREEAQYLELATLEHKLLQEERRHRTVYENAEEAEREKFALFSAGVRESHEKERERAERTKNWSIIGSVLGALIGVMGSTYINRVRLQELRSLLLEAQKGPASLQEAIRVQASTHKSQQEELRGLINILSSTISERPVEKSVGTSIAPPHTTDPQSLLPSTTHPLLKGIQQSTQRVQALMESLHPQLVQLDQRVVKVQSQLQAMRLAFDDHHSAEKEVVGTEQGQMMVFNAEGVMQGLAQTEKRLEAQITKTTLYNTVLTYTAFAVTLPLLYFIFKGN